MVRVTVTGPDGKRVHRPERNIKALDGRAKMAMPFALNDPVGKYTVNLREIAAGLTEQLTFTVTGAQRLLPEPTLEKYPVPDMPDGKELWRGSPGKHIPWAGATVEEKPLPIERSILVNPTLLERNEDGTPKGWNVQVRRARKWILKKEAMEYIRIAEDKEVLFRGRPTTRIEIGHPEYPDWHAYWSVAQHVRGAKLKALAGKTIRVRFFALRTDGLRTREYDAIVRIRVQATGNSGYHDFVRRGGTWGGDAKATCFKNVWTEAGQTMTLPPTLHTMDVTLFGKFKDPLRFHGFLIEVLEDGNAGQ